MDAVVAPRVRRTARVGISGGTDAGKSALIEQLVPQLIARCVEVGVISDGAAGAAWVDRLRASRLIHPDRVVGVTPAASEGSLAADLQTQRARASRQLANHFPVLDLIIVKSSLCSGTNLYEDALLDGWITVLDATRRSALQGAGDADIVECDLLVINKIDLAAASNVDVQEVIDEAARLRVGRPSLPTNCATGEGVEAVVEWLAHAVHQRAARMS